MAGHKPHEQKRCSCPFVSELPCERAANGAAIRRRDTRVHRSKAMVSLQYKGRIHKAKFTLRTVRYILSDQAARAVPALQRRWLLPVEALPIARAAENDLAIPTAAVEAPFPDCLTELGIPRPEPLQL